MRGHGVRIELDGLAELLDRGGILAGLEEVPAEIAVDDGRQRVERVRAPDLVDRLAILAGVGLVVAGVSMISPPAAVILTGLFLLAGALWRART